MTHCYSAFIKDTSADQVIFPQKWGGLYLYMYRFSQFTRTFLVTYRYSFTERIESLVFNHIVYFKKLYFKTRKLKGNELTIKRWIRVLFGGETMHNHLMGISPVISRMTLLILLILTYTTTKVQSSTISKKTFR